MKFEEEDSINLPEIVKVFELKNIHNQPVSEKTYNILEESKKFNSELINLHIDSKSKTVGYGKIYSSILGNVLVSFNGMTTATAYNIFERKSTDGGKKPKKKKGENARIIDMSEFEVAKLEAASFSVFLKPVYSEKTWFDDQTSSEKIANQIFSLFARSEKLEELKEFKDAISDGLLSSFNDFLKEIKEHDLDVVVQYGAPNAETPYERKYSFNAAKAIKTLDTLEQLEYEKTSTIDLKGRFSALDSTNSSFKFEDLSDDSYQGKFDTQLHEKIKLLTLKDLYSISISVEVKKKTGSKKEIIKYKMVRCEPDTSMIEDGEIAFS